MKKTNRNQNEIEPINELKSSSTLSIVQPILKPLNYRLAIVNCHCHHHPNPDDENIMSQQPTPPPLPPRNKLPPVLPIKQQTKIKISKIIQTKSFEKNFFRNWAIFFLGCFIFSITIYQSIIYASKKFFF